MNASLFKTSLLATGQATPFTGDWASTVDCRNGFIVTYVSGAAINMNLQAKTELAGETIFTAGGSADNISFYTGSAGPNGYASPLFFDSPVSNIRLATASATGSRVWSYISYQN